MKSKLLLYCSLLVGLQLYGQNSPDLSNLSLAKAIDIALQNAYTQRNADLDIELAKQRIRETTGIGLPQISASAGINNFIQLPVNLIPADAFVPGAPPDQFLRLAFGTKYSANAGFTVSQLIFSGEYLVGLQASRTYKSLSEANSRKNQAEIKEQISKAYSTVLLLNETKQILERNLSNIDSLITQTEAFYKEGFMELQDVDKLKLTRSSLAVNLSALSQQTSVAEQFLKFQMGVDVNASLSLSDSFNQFVIAATSFKNQTYTFNFDESVDRLILDNAVKLQELGIKRYRSQALPSLAGFYSFTQNYFGQEFRDLSNSDFSVPGGTILGLSLRFPLFTGLSRTAQIGGARVELKKVENQYQQAKQGYYLQANNSKTEYSNAFEKYQNATEAVKLAERIYQTSKVKFKEGISNSFELTQAQSDLLQSQASLIQASSDLITAYINLQKAQNKF